MDYKDWCENHYENCLDCQKGVYAKIEDCPAFKDEGDYSDYLYEQEKERQAEEQFKDYPTKE